MYILLHDASIHSMCMRRNMMTRRNAHRIESHHERAKMTDNSIDMCKGTWKTMSGSIQPARNTWNIMKMASTHIENTE